MLTAYGVTERRNVADIVGVLDSAAGRRQIRRPRMQLPSGRRQSTLQGRCRREQAPTQEVPHREGGKRGKNFSLRSAVPGLRMESDLSIKAYFFLLQF